MAFKYRTLSNVSKLIRTATSNHLPWDNVTHSHLTSVTNLKYGLSMHQLCLQSSISTSSHDRGLARFANALTSRKLEYSQRKLVKHPTKLMYNIVEDVDKYCEFVPWCKKSVVLAKKGSVKKAKLEVGFGKILEKYNSTITCAEPHLVKAVCTDGILFNSLVCIWRFAPGKTSNSCIIDFQVVFEFRSLFYSQICNMVFNEIARTMVSAFEKRAVQLHVAEKLHESKFIKSSQTD